MCRFFLEIRVKTRVSVKKQTNKQTNKKQQQQQQMEIQGSFLQTNKQNLEIQASL